MSTLVYCFRAAEWKKWHLIAGGNIESTHAECGVTLNQAVDPTLIDETSSELCRRCLRVVHGLAFQASEVQT